MPFANKQTEPMVCLSVDLDPLWAYQRIHGLPETHDGHWTITTLALERFTDLARQVGIPITFFMVTSDLEISDCEAAAAKAFSQGHELANHTRDHLYDLLVLDDETIRAQVLAGHERIREVTGQAPKGFRAPGYGQAPGLVHLLEELGYDYDSSMLPSPPYYAAKAAIMAAMRITGRPSRAHLHRLQTVLGPTVPYRMDENRPWRTGRGPLVEFPMTVLPILRIPFIGTTLTLAGQKKARWLTELASRSGFVTFECHGVDLLDVTDLPPECRAVSEHQPDLKRPWRTKRLILAEALERLAQDHAFVTMAEAAARLAPVL